MARPQKGEKAQEAVHKLLGLKPLKVSSHGERTFTEGDSDGGNGSKEEAPSAINDNDDE